MSEAGKSNKAKHSHRNTPQEKSILLAGTSRFTPATQAGSDWLKSLHMWEANLCRLVVPHCIYLLYISLLKPNMSFHNSATHKSENTAISDSASGLTASLVEQIPEDYDHNMTRFLAHPQTSTERPPLGFRKIESEEEAKARVKTSWTLLVQCLAPASSNPPPN
ncbi:hypothetical protein V8C34DRAFT_269950 [Trichoderma compactum]